VSAVGFGGKPLRVVELALKQEFLLVASQHIFDEIQRNLVRKIGLSVRDAQKLLDDIAEVAALFDPGGSLTITADSNDNLVIETALMGFAEILVTGDRELVDLKTVGQLRIETTSVFLERFKK
jgi:putative PIN family toxin of toxin-antitoxin system